MFISCTLARDGKKCNTNSNKPNLFLSIIVKEILNKTFAAKIFGPNESVGAKIGSHILVFRQRLAENNEFNAFFTDCHA